MVGIRKINLVSVYDVDSQMILYRLLEERPAVASISHRSMPDWDEHVAFITSMPYHVWCLIMNGAEAVGAIYLTQNDEIGVSIFEKHAGNGYAKAAIRRLMETYPRRRYFANINPDNAKSIRMFETLGFRHIQNTYELNA